MCVSLSLSPVCPPDDKRVQESQNNWSQGKSAGNIGNEMPTCLRRADYLQASWRHSRAYGVKHPWIRLVLDSPTTQSRPSQSKGYPRRRTRAWRPLSVDAQKHGHKLITCYVHCTRQVYDLWLCGSRLLTAPLSIPRTIWLNMESRRKTYPKQSSDVD